MTNFGDLERINSSLATFYTFLQTHGGERYSTGVPVSTLVKSVAGQTKLTIDLIDLIAIQEIVGEDDIAIENRLWDEESDDRGRMELILEYTDVNKPVDKKRRTEAQFQLIVRRRDRFTKEFQKYKKLNPDAESNLYESAELKRQLLERDEDAVNAIDIGIKTDMKLVSQSVKEMSDKNQLVAEYYTEVVTAKYAETQQGIVDERLLNCIGELGMEKLFTHQAIAIDAVVSHGKNVIVTTPTASGKSLVYQLPVLHHLLQPSTNNATALYIFPTKALTQDQQRSFGDLKHLFPELDGVVVSTYDGDTLDEDRDRIRRTAQVIFTNPDKLHASVLPNWTMWRNLLINLKIVVVDELHVYTGLFGVNVAMVMRRLQRILHHLGNHDVQFVSCSATISNPVSLMSTIFAIDRESIEWVSEDGSPHAAKRYLVWNAPFMTPSDPTSGRVHAVTETSKILCHLVKHNVRTIVFCKLRRSVELLVRSVRDALSQELPEYVNRVVAYRGGYTPQERRQIERDMLSGDLLVVVATNALELGIDIGSLDAVICCGFPFSMASLRQQFGRVGRRTRNNQEALAMLVGGGDAVDQYYMKNPREILDAPYGEANIPLEESIYVCDGHLQCAAFELAINEMDEPFFPELDVSHLVQTQEDGYYTCNDRYLPWPPEKVSLRMSNNQKNETIAVVDTGADRVIELIEPERATFSLYDGGIFLHQGKPFLIEDFDPDNRLARVRRVNVDWTTHSRDFTDVDALQPMEKTKLNEQMINYGPVKITSIVFGYFKFDKRHKIIESVEVDCPPFTRDTNGWWISVPALAIRLITENKLSLAGGIHTACHAVMNVAPIINGGLEVMRTECKAAEKEFAKKVTARKRPALLIWYDEGGPNGVSHRAFGRAVELFHAAMDIVDNCPCDHGCPECVASAKCKEHSIVISKPAAKIILSSILNLPIDEAAIPKGPEPHLVGTNTETIVY
ncbi:ATP-dependent helicase Hrq1p [Trichomonascus vanleenenianus]|uniref:ATP-dependent 3'-5' DNA helicase n=1 Tax=Trichomonascus vanleenenianus TaxID=2268995 RepID=UPI003EC95D00